MSDTDDTDLLLLIPPNFFLIQSSDSEDYDKTDLYEDRREIERAVVNDLITQVNELESRVCAIESSDSSFSLYNGVQNQSFDSLDFKNTKFVDEDCSSAFQLMPLNSQLNSSSDKFNRHTLCFSSDKGATKLRNRFSLPSSPTSHKNTGLRTKNQISLSERSPISKDKNVEHSEISVSNPNDISDCKFVNNNNLYNDENSIKIAFGSTVNSISSKSDKPLDPSKMNCEVSEKVIEGESNSHMAPNGDFNNSQNFTEPKNSPLKLNEGFGKQFSNLNLGKNDDTIEKNLELSDVDKLLKEMEETQMEIEHKLKLREIHYNKSKSDDFRCKEVFKQGDNISSVPDLGFGVRDLFYQKTSHNCEDSRNVSNGASTNNKDLVEEPFIQSKISMLGHSAGQDMNRLQEEKCNTSALSSPLMQSPYKQNSKMTPLSGGAINGRESPFSRARKKINFSPSRDVSAHLRSPLKSNDRRDWFENDKGYTFKSGLIDVGKCFDGSSSADDKRDNEDGAHKVLLSQRLSKSKPKYPRMFRDFDRQNFRNSKLNLKYGAKERTQDHSGSRSNNLMSLSDLWNYGAADSGIHIENDPVKLLQKLEEEKYRRQHCEQEIHELQKRVLDDQERLAVAVQVDKEKDIAITKLWNGWQQLANHWTELEEQRHSLTKQLEAQTKAYDAQAEDIRKKVDRWEKELSKALDLAAGYKEKCHLISAEREEIKAELEGRIQEVLNELSGVKNENIKCMEENNKLVEKLNSVQAESEKIALRERLQSCLYFMRELDKQLVLEYQKKLLDIEEKLNQFEAEICVLREQKENLSLKLKDELARNKSVSEQKISLQQAVDNLKKQEKILKDEVRAATERLEVSRVELRALYQGQLEAVVKEKLREFQSQLNAAEAALRAELLSREKVLADQAVQQCQVLTERHKTEIAGIEERHKSQLKAFVKKIEQLESQKFEAELKLKHETDRRTEIAQKLHSVMETQWRQALNIISSSAAGGDSKSHIEFPRKNDHEDMRLDLQNLAKSQPNSASSSNQDTAPFNKSDGMSTYRLVNSGAEVSSDTKVYDNGQQTHHLKKYIQMLLDKTPGNPVPEVLNQTSSSLGPDEIQHLNSSCVTNDSLLTDEQIVDKIASAKGRDKFSSKSKGVEGILDRRQQLQNINRILKQQPWK